MVADALTKLATPEVIKVLIDAMEGQLPSTVAAHASSVTPGRANRSDMAGDGPSTPHPAQPPRPGAAAAQGGPGGGTVMFEGIVHPDVPRDHPVWGELLRAMCEKWIPGSDLTSLPE
eukprot:1706794-Pyramimonas_sp.AAC.1